MTRRFVEREGGFHRDDSCQQQRAADGAEQSASREGRASNNLDEKCEKTREIPRLSMGIIKPVSLDASVVHLNVGGEHLDVCCAAPEYVHKTNIKQRWTFTHSKRQGRQNRVRRISRHQEASCPYTAKSFHSNSGRSDAAGSHHISTPFL